MDRGRDGFTHRAGLAGGSAHLEFPEVLGTEDEGADVSLITGELRAVHLSTDPVPPASTALACRSQTLDLAEITSFLQSRSWQGLEQQLGQTPVRKAVEGRRGIAIAYEDEACG
uniref:Uncharacterized protein n=1 Tax=Crocodylus porosus TaxID=8502 RepID=A0A7M4FKE6_CROPO